MFTFCYYYSYIGGVDPASVAEKDLRSHFSQFGEIKAIHCVAKSSAAFVEFSVLFLFFIYCFIIIIILASLIITANFSSVYNEYIFI